VGRGRDSERNVSVMAVERYVTRSPEALAVRWVPDMAEADMARLCEIAGSEFEAYEAGYNGDDPDARGSYRSLDSGCWKALYDGALLIFESNRLYQVDVTWFFKQYKYLEDV
jgi:hypothetical protein